MRSVRMAVLCLSVSLAGCGSTGSTGTGSMGFLNSATSSAGSVIGQAIGQAVVRRYSPQFTRYYTGYLMQMAFNSQGYSLMGTTAEYRPGDYTAWAVISDDDVPENLMRRALLERTENGQDWWQVVYEDNASEDIIIMEALFSENQEQMLRLRTQFPGDDGPQEVPVDDQNYQPPRVLTEQSIAGATEGNETLQIPAGTFETTRVRFGTGSMQEVWWLSDQVPGGIVQHQMSSATEQNAPDDAEDMPMGAYTMQLQSFGEGATSRF